MPEFSLCRYRSVVAPFGDKKSRPTQSGIFCPKLALVYMYVWGNRHLSWNFTLPVCKPGFSGITGQWLNIAFNSCVSIGSVLYWLPMVAARRLVQYSNARKPIFTLAGTTIEVRPVHLANDLHPISVTFSPIGKVFSPLQP